MVRDVGTRTAWIEDPKYKVLGYDVRELGGQQGLRIAGKWVQQRGQSPTNKENEELQP